MSEIKLKSCPFCEGEAEIFEDEPKQFYVACTNPECKCEACLPFATTKEEAIKAWNTRKPIEKAVKELEELQQYYIYSIDDLVRLSDVKKLLKGSGLNEHNE